MDYRPETYVEFKDYQDQLFRDAVKNHWKSKIKAEDLQNQTKKATIPKLTINAKFLTGYLEATRLILSLPELPS